MSASSGEPGRPAGPDPRLLRAAASFLGSDTNDPDDIGWEVLRRIERPRSTVFILRTVAQSGAPIEAYYKVAHVPPYEGERKRRWEETLRTGLARSMELEERLATLLNGEDIAFSRALAVDSDALAVVTLAVPGQAMGKVWRHSLTKRSRSLATRALTLAGRAARLIEESSPDLLSTDATQTTAVERRLARVRSILPESTMRQLERTMAELSSELVSGPQSMVYCHGDFSSSNLLIDGNRIGLIDFGWALRQRGFDVAHFAFRLEYDTAIPPRMTAPLTDALLDGYGDPDVTEKPGYRFVRLSKLLKVVEDGKGGALGLGSGRTRRALTEIDSYI